MCGRYAHMCAIICVKWRIHVCALNIRYVTCVTWCIDMFDSSLIFVAL